MNVEIKRAIAEFDGCIARYVARPWWGDLAGAMDWWWELRVLGYDVRLLDFKGADVRKAAFSLEELGE